MSGLSSVWGLLSLLEEADEDLRRAALGRILTAVDELWYEVSEYLPQLQRMSQDPSFPDHELASLIVSKVYYHLGDEGETLRFALDAGESLNFGTSGSSSSAHVDEYLQRTLALCIDRYVKTRQSTVHTDDGDDIDPRLEDLLKRLIDRSASLSRHEVVFGVCLDSELLDGVRDACLASHRFEFLERCLERANQTETRGPRGAFRTDLLNMVVELGVVYEGVEGKTLSAECLLKTGDAGSVGSLIGETINHDVFHSYQMCFDMFELAPRRMIQQMIECLRIDLPESKIREKLIEILNGSITRRLFLEFLYRHNKTNFADLNRIKKTFQRSSVMHYATVTANAFMNCGTTVDSFLRKNLKWLSKASNWGKFSATASLGVMHYGQVTDGAQVLKPYLPRQAGGQSDGGKYSEGGALYGLGLIHANHHQGPVTEVLLAILQNRGLDKVILHGACLSAGACCLASGDMRIANCLEEILGLDEAVSGESAALGIGLVLMGSGHSGKTNFLLETAAETQHEKIIRGCGLGVALLHFQREEHANLIVRQMLNSEDPLVRYGGIFTLALAFVGTAKEVAIRRLLEVAVTDVSDDVRRAAAIALGFVLCRHPELAPRTLPLLWNSFNPHVRYGVAFALAIACGNRPNVKALEMLKVLCADKQDFVRQAAMMASAMILCQSNDGGLLEREMEKERKKRVAAEESAKKQRQQLTKKKGTEETPAAEEKKPETEEPEKEKEPEVKDVGYYVRFFRDEYAKVWSTRDELLAKVGAILSTGLIDLAGRNASLSCLTPSGSVRFQSVAGLFVFMQHWWWYPYVHYLVLGIQPSCTIAVNTNLEMMELRILSNAKPSTFDYCPMRKDEREERKALAPLVALSQRKRRHKRGPRASAHMTPFSPFSPTRPHSARGTQPEPAEEAPEEPAPPEEPEKEEEPEFEWLENPARVTPQQVKHLKWDRGVTDFKPVRYRLGLGVNVIRNAEDGKLGTAVKMTVRPTVMKEPEPPAPFELDMD